MLVPLGLLWLTVFSGKQSKQPTELPCNLEALNVAYVRVLQRRRQTQTVNAATIVFDRNMLYGTLLHNYALQRTQQLFHDSLTFHAELCGSLSNIEQFVGQPYALAEYIWRRCDESTSGHAAIQADRILRYVSISCTRDFFVVRLSAHPAKTDQQQFRRYTATLKVLEN